MKKSNDALVIGLVSVAHGTSHFFQLILAPLFPMIKDDLGVSYAALGFALTLFYTLSALFQPVTGFVVDRFGARAALFFGVGMQTLGVFTMGATHGYPLFVLGAAMTGLGNSVFHPADFTLLNSKVSPQRLGYAYSAHGMGGSLGYAAAPAFSGALGVLYGWHAALLAAAAIGLVMFLALLSQAKHLHVTPGRAGEAKSSAASDIRVLLVAPVILCFLYFAIYSAGLLGIQNFSITAMTMQYGVAAAFASAAVTAYMIGSAAGIFLGGFIATRASRHDLVAATGLAAGAATMLVIALGQIPGAALPAAFACTGFLLGATGPSRDLIVRAATPAGATGRVYGFVYSGLDFGAVSTPIFYGWMLDHGLPQGVFFLVAGLTAAAIFTVLQVPGRTRRAAAT
jgi:FSR family fosmidomycin resistance protein-like MFS transporter